MTISGRLLCRPFSGEILPRRDKYELDIDFIMSNPPQKSARMRLLGNG